MAATHLLMTFASLISPAVHACYAYLALATRFSLALMQAINALTSVVGRGASPHNLYVRNNALGDAMVQPMIRALPGGRVHVLDMARFRPVHSHPWPEASDTGACVPGLSIEHRA